MPKGCLLLSVSLLLTCYGSVFGQTGAASPQPSSVVESTDPVVDAFPEDDPILLRADWLAVTTPDNPADQAAPRMTQGAADGEKRQSVYDKIWKLTEWYKDETNPVIQSVSFGGRFHYDYAAINADEGNHHEWNIRRMRLGPKLTLFRKFTFISEVEFNLKHDPFYSRFTDFYVQWNQSDRFALIFGKQRVAFTMDGSISSRELITIDRSNLTNNIWFTEEYLSGVGVSGKVAPWVYRAGVYSAGAKTREFGKFSGDLFTLGVVGYDFGKKLNVKEALLAGNYGYQHPDPNNTFTRQLEHVASINFRFETDGWGVRTDLSAATGYLGQSDLWGVMANPFMNFTDNLQFVGRYTFLESERPNGLRLALYESVVAPGRGDRYNELYGGANYYFYGHKLKLQSGVQWADMNDRANDGGAYSGVAWTTGLRVGW